MLKHYDIAPKQYVWRTCWEGRAFDEERTECCIWFSGVCSAILCEPAYCQESCPASCCLHMSHCIAYQYTVDASAPSDCESLVSHTQIIREPLLQQSSAGASSCSAHQSACFLGHPTVAVRRAVCPPHRAAFPKRLLGSLDLHMDTTANESRVLCSSP